MAGIYIHIPFCVSKCSYCDFYSCTSLGKRDAFVDALLEEMRARKDYLSTETVRTVYFGGGTPSLLPPEQISRLLDEIASNFELQAEEITLEANPDDLSPGYLAALGGTGINRLSIGTQSFDDGQLRLMNRRHTAAQAEKAIRDAQQAGFDNISADLIFGIPGMDDAAWNDNIDRTLSLGVQHISAYHLTIEQGTPFNRMAELGEISPVDEDTSERQYGILRERLTGAGFEHYEISNFALPGSRARHNASYWQGLPYLGLGPSAHSYDGRRRHYCLANLDRYIAVSPSPELFETEELSVDDLYNEYVMVRLRCLDGIELADMERQLGAGATSEFIRKAEKMVKDGFLQNKAGRINVPPERLLVSDRIISWLFNV